MSDTPAIVSFRLSVLSVKQSHLSRGILVLKKKSLARSIASLATDALETFFLRLLLRPLKRPLFFRGCATPPFNVWVDFDDAGILVEIAFQSNSDPEISNGC